WVRPGSTSRASSSTTVTVSVGSSGSGRSSVSRSSSSEAAGATGRSGTDSTYSIPSSAARSSALRPSTVRVYFRYHFAARPALFAMSTIIQDLERRQLREVPRFKAGDTVRVHFKVIEGNRQRIQVYEGIVIKRQGAGVRETFTVRKNSFGVGVERTFPLHSPKIDKIDVTAVGDVNRAKLYYLRGRIGKKARVRVRRARVGPRLSAGGDRPRRPA